MIDERGEMDPIEERQRFRRGYIHTVSLFLMIMAIAMGSYYIWEIYLDPAAQKEAEQVSNYKTFLETYEEAMRADTYGGKTPSETLGMFIDALEKGDIDLASRYFLLEQNPESPDYLTRRKWEDALLQAKNENRLEGIVASVKSTELQGESENGASYSSFKDGLTDVLVELKKNEQSGVWKIESL